MNGTSAAGNCAHDEVDFGFDYVKGQGAGQPSRLAFRMRCKGCRTRFRFPGIPPMEDQPHPLSPSTVDRIGATVVLPVLPCQVRETAMLDAVMPWPDQAPPAAPVEDPAVEDPAEDEMARADALREV